jgi:hypothetical protein
MDNIIGDTDSIKATLLRMLELKGLEEAHSVVSSSNLEVEQIGYDNWNGGTYDYRINLELPIESFVHLEHKIEALEKEILTIIQPLWKTNENINVSSVAIQPLPLTSDGIRRFSPLGHSRLPSFWTPGNLRLFISHTSANGANASALQESLTPFGVSGFVAHVDIEPTKEWEAEIFKALQTMDALVAILTPDFPNSKWCDQEVGIAFGLDRLVIPLRAGIDPYGFMARHQAITCSPDNIAASVPQIAEVLLKNEMTAASMTNAIVRAFSSSWNFATSKALISLIEMFPKLSSDHARLISNALKFNVQVIDSWGVPGRVQQVLSKHGFKELAV